MVCLECRNWGVHELGLYGTVCWSKLCKILLLLNIADMDCLYVEGCGVSRAEYSVHLVGVNSAGPSAPVNISGTTLETGTSVYVVCIPNLMLLCYHHKIGIISTP